MGLIDVDLGIGDIIGIGKAASSVLRGVSNKETMPNNTAADNNNDENSCIINQSKNIVIKCPGCGHKSAINDGDGVEDRCEYCGTVIGN